MTDKTMKYELLLGGETLSPGTLANIKKISFQERFFETSRLEVECENGVHFDLDFADAKVETPVTLKLGYFGDLHEVFSGEISIVEPNFQKAQDSDTLILTALDFSDNMKSEKTPSIYSETNPYDIAVRVIKRHNLTPVIEPAGILRSLRHKKGQGLNQKKLTDWELLTMIAKKVNFKLFCQGTTVYLVGDEYLSTRTDYTRLHLIHNPSVEEMRAADTWELNFFNPNSDKARQRTKATVKAWDAYNADGELIGKADLAKVKGGTQGFTEIRVEETKEKVITVYAVARTLAQAQALAEKELDRRAEELVIGNVRLRGCPELRIGQRHDITAHSFGDFGKAFSGEYFFKAVRHDMTGDGFMTKADIAKRTIEI